MSNESNTPQIMPYLLTLSDAGTGSILIKDAQVDESGIFTIMFDTFDFGTIRSNKFIDELKKCEGTHAYSDEDYSIEIRPNEPGELIDWAQIEVDWVTHWRNRPSDVDLEDSFNQFWEDRGGRDKYVTVSPNGTLIPNVFKMETK